MAKIYIKPAKGLKIRHVDKIDYILDENGEWVEDNSMWQRRLRDGDVVLVKDKAEQTPEEKPAKHKHAAEGDK